MTGISTTASVFKNYTFKPEEKVSILIKQDQIRDAEQFQDMKEIGVVHVLTKKPRAAATFVSALNGKLDYFFKRHTDREGFEQ